MGCTEWHRTTPLPTLGILARPTGQGQGQGREEWCQEDIRNITHPREDSTILLLQGIIRGTILRLPLFLLLNSVFLLKK